MSADKDKGEHRTTEHFYEQLYGISRLSPRYWWRRRARHRLLFALLFLMLTVVPLAVALSWSSLRPRLATPYHALRARLFNVSAERFLKAGDAASARIQVQNSLRHNPGNAAAMALFARTMKDLGEQGYSLWALQAHFADPDNPERARYALGAAIEEQQTEIAAFILSEALPRFPKDAPLHILACHVLLQQGRLAAALREAQQAKQLAPDNPEAYFLAATLSARSGDARVREEGLAGLRNFREKPPYFTRASWALVAALAPRDPRAALAILDELIAHDPTAWPPRLRRVAIAHTIEPAKTPAALRTLWAAATKPGQRRGVIETAENIAPPEAQALLDSLDPAAANSLAFVLPQFRLWALAKSWRNIADRAGALSATIEPAAARVTVGLWLAKAHKALGEEDASRTCLRSALNRCQGNSALALDAAMLLERLGLPEAASPFYALVLQTPGRLGAFARSRIAAADHIAGRTTDMLASWQQALASNPADPQAMNNVAACLLLLGQDPHRALKLAAEAHAARPNSLHYADTHALALASIGRTDEALAIHAKLPPRRLQQPEFALNFASVLNFAGQHQNAAALLTNINDQLLLPEQRQRLLQIRGPAHSTSPPVNRVTNRNELSPPFGVGNSNRFLPNPAIDHLLLPLVPPAPKH